MSLGLLAGIASLAVLLVLIQVTWLRIPAFVALLVSTILVALVAGIPASEVIGTVQEGMGSILGYIAVVIGLGAMFGGLLEASGGARAIADALLERFGSERAPSALALTGLVISTPVFFDVALVLLIPLAYAVARDAGRSLILFALPLIAGIAVAHAFIPPTPGPVAVAALLDADLGWVLVAGVVTGVPAMLVGGLLYSRWIAPRVSVRTEALPSLASSHYAAAGSVGEPQVATNAAPGATAADVPSRTAPGATAALSVLALPLLLIVAGSVARAATETAPGWLILVSHPFTALALGLFLAFYVFGLRAGMSMDRVRDICGRALEPVGLIILVTGAGGALGKVLVAAGADEVVAQAASGSGAPVLVLAFGVAAVVRVVQGSATVSMITAAGLVAPLVTAGSSAALPVLATIVIASGATVTSHVNDSGFWLVSRYVGLSERDAFKVWTVASTLIGLTGFAGAMLLSLVL